MRRIVLLVTGTICAASAALAQHEHHGGAETVGRVSFPSSCSPAVQPTLDRAVAMLHSFWFEEAAETFSAIAERDSTCAMAHWGMAMTMWGNPLVRLPIPPARQQAGLAAAERAAALARSASHREQMYAAAALALWRDAETQDHLARLARHEAALQRLHEAHPEDPEATIFFARAVIANAPPSDLTFARQKYAATLLVPLFEQHAEHPGLAHYTIHTFDSPALAAHGLEAARRYAAIAPAAPHALHMPSHIFTRLGLWEESIETNRRSANAEPDSNGAVHPNDYMVYAYLQLGRDGEAAQVVRRSREAADRFYGGVIGYNAIAMQARYALERSAWQEATDIAVPSSGAPFIAAVARFARALGFARGGDAAAAAGEVEALARLRDSLRTLGDAYWPTIVEAQRLASAAWMAKAQGRTDEALRLATEGADLEETVEKHPVTPGPLLPARELLGDLLSELGRHGDALVAYERTLAREPNRARTLFGAARAAERSGKRDAARKHYEALAQLMANADPTREELRIARRYLSTSG